MMRVEDFSKNLFTTLAHKLIHEPNLNISEENDYVVEKLEYSDSSDDVSRSVLMLSYVYRPAFEERFIEVFPNIMRANSNLRIYVRCFAEVLHEKYSPLKFLILCSFISESYHFLSNYLVLKTKHLYVQQTTKALNDAFHRIFEQDFPQNGWTDIKKEASKLARGFKFLEPFMNKETPNTTVSQVADAILTNNYEFENKHQHTNVMMAGEPSQQVVNANTSHNESFAPIFSTLLNIPVIGVPILSDEGLPTNKITYIDQNQSHISFSFGTIDQDPQISFLVPYYGYQDEIVTFENQPFGMDPNVPVETIDSSNSESKVQENLPARSSENEAGPSFRTVKITENGMREVCSENDVVISEQELIAGQKKLWEDLFLSDSEDESGSPFQIDRKVENWESENCMANNEIISEQELINAEEKFWEGKSNLSSRTELKIDAIEQYFHGLKVKSDCTSETFQKDENANDPEGKTFSKEENVNDPEGKTFSKEENVNDPEGKTLPKEENVNDPEGKTLPKEENVNDPEGKTFPKEENVNDLEGKTFLKEENVNDSDGNTFPKEENFNDSESETFSKNNTLATGNVVNVPENQSETFYQKQSNAALQLFITNEAVSSHKNEAQANKIEINFQTDENNLSTKVLYLNLGGKNFVLRMPADITLIFKYSGSILNS